MAGSRGGNRVVGGGGDNGGEGGCREGSARVGQKL